MTDRFDSLKKAIECYSNSADADFWGVLSNPFMLIRQKMITSLIASNYYPKALDFACGLGVMLRAIKDNIGYGLGLDGAAPAIEKARQLHSQEKGLEFAVGDPDDLERYLVRDRFNLLIITDSLSYFHREQQKRILELAWKQRVGSLLLEIRAVDPACPGRCSYHEDYDFRRVDEILNFIHACGYEVLRCRISRFYDRVDILRRSAYNPLRRIAAFLLRRAIDALTAIALMPKRRLGDEVYDPLALELRLRFASRLYGQPLMGYLIEPMIGYIALLCRRCDTLISKTD